MGKIIDHIDDKLKVFDPIYRAEHGLGGQRDRYYDRTGVAKWREWRGVKDTMYDYERWLINVVSMVKMVASAPIPIMKGFWEYRWMGSYLGTFMFIDRLFEGYRDQELRVAHLQMHAIVVNLTKRIAYILSHDRRLGASMEKSANLLPMDETLPAFFTTGFPDLFPMPLQTLPEFIICDIDQHIEPYYIDYTQWNGTAYGVLRTDENAENKRDVEQRFMGDRYFYANDTTDGKVLAIFPDGKNGIWTVMEEGYSHIDMVEMNGTDKAATMSDTTQAHVARRGMVSNAYLIDGDWIPEESDNDGLWTSMYGGGELMRYAVLKNDPNATAEEIAAWEELKSQITQIL